MKIATWNINSVRPRLQRLLKFLERHQPDALCLQELKCQDGEFPHLEVNAAGYRAATFGQKTYNGVAILAREEPQDVVRSFSDGDDDAQARFIAATVGGVRVASLYCPNGQEVGSGAYSYKLAWFKRLRAWLDRHHTPKEALVLCGDFNVAPDDRDCYDPVGWHEQTLCTSAERVALTEVCGFGLTDTLREKNPEGAGPFTWWDYRMLGFQKNKGMRIDHVLATATLAERCTAVVVDREERKSNKADKDDKPSDHAPVLATFEVGPRVDRGFPFNETPKDTP